MKRWALFILLTALLAARSGQEVEVTDEPHHHLVFANDQIRVFDVDVAAHSETLMHWHRHDYFFVVIGDSKIVNAVEGKDRVTLALADGEVRFAAAPFAHIFRNLGEQPFRNVTVELLQDEKMRHSSVKWDEERGLDVLHGGTKEVILVKDSVRASEFELQPNAAIPTQPRSGPLLLIAVTDLDLFTNDPRTHGPPEPDPLPASHFNSGNSIWLPYGFRRPIINAGHHAAKFVTLEFP